MKRITLMSMVLSWAAPTLAAQTPKDTVHLPEIVVTATRVRWAAVTASTTIISGRSLQQMGITHVAEALAALTPGATVVRTGSFGGTTDLFFRGGQPGYTRVLLDGVPLNDPGGTFDFGALTTAGVDRIEVVRGPASVLYGSDAVSGVIQIFTRRGSGPLRVSTELEAGNYGTASLGAHFTGGSPIASYGLHLSRYQTSGIYAFNNAYHDTRLSGAVRLTPDDRTDVTVTTHYLDDIYHVPTNSGGQVVDHNAFQFGRRYTIGIDAGRRLGSVAEARLQLSTYTTDGGFDNQPDGPGDTLGFYADRSLQAIERRSADARLHVYGWGGVLTLGGAVEQERERSLDQSQSQFGALAGAFDADRRNAAAYAQLLGGHGRLTWNASTRVDWNQTFGTFGTYRAGAALALWGGLRARGSFGTAFREPTFYENFATGFVLGNPGLSPERAASWEAGVEHLFPGGVGRASVVWFDQRFENLIDFTFSPPGPGEPHYFNVAAAQAQGLELSLSARSPVGLVLAGQYTLLDTRVTDPGFDSTALGLFVRGQRLIRRPPHAGSLSLEYDGADGGSVGLRLNHVGARDDIDYTNAMRVSLAPCTTLDISAEYPPVRREQLSLVLRMRVSNVMNHAYQAVAGFPAPGRSLLAGADVEF